MKKTLRIFALGGNEISPTGQVDPETGKMIVPDVKTQWVRSSRTCNLIAGIVKNHPEDMFVVAHGNGPQVGNILLRSEYASKIIHTLPLDVCGANSQGAIGYMLAQLTNSLHMNGLNKVAAETVTQVVVDSKDPAFQDPAKYIGPAMTKEEADIKVKNDGWLVKLYKKNDEGIEVWRRVVASPKPIDVVELDIIEANLNAGMIPIAVGGGGVPVSKVAPRIENGEEVYECHYGIEYRRPVGEFEVPAAIYKGEEAVIDKDLASALLGTMLKSRAEKRGEDIDAELTIFTDVDGAKLNFQQPDQIDLKVLTADEAQKLVDEGKFPAGSMGPKMMAAINFVRNGGQRAYITKVDLFEETLKGNAGTTIVP